MSTIAATATALSLTSSPALLILSDHLDFLFGCHRVDIDIRVHEEIIIILVLKVKIWLFLARALADGLLLSLLKLILSNRCAISF